MYFWRINELKRDLISGPLSQKQQFQYVLAEAIIVGAVTIPWLVPNRFDTIHGILVLVLSILGTLYFYHRNGRSNGDRFMERYFSIGFVIAVRQLVFLVLPVMLVQVLISEIVADVSTETTLLDVIVWLALGVVYFWRMAIHVSDVSRVSAA